MSSNAPAFEKVGADAFAARVAAGASSATFKEQYARYRPRSYDGRFGPDFRVHHGDIAIGGNWRVPGFQTLIAGNLAVDGLVDLANPYDEGFDEGGQFIVLGNVRCRAFINEYGKVSMVDGALEASDVVVNDFEDSALVVIGDLRTRFFQGLDLWAEVGGSAFMEYGDGYCLPIGYSDATAQAMLPRHGEVESRKQLNPKIDPVSYKASRDMCAMLRAGKDIFRQA